MRWVYIFPGFSSGVVWCGVCRVAWYLTSLAVMMDEQSKLVRVVVVVVLRLFPLSTAPLLLLYLALTSACPFPKQRPPRVDLGYTAYEGIRLQNGVDAFLGMRYAAPPVGDLRWRAPVEPPVTGTVEPAVEVGIVSS